MLHNETVQPDIIGLSHYDFPIITMMNTGNLNVVLTWHEGEAEQTVTQALAL